MSQFILHKTRSFYDSSGSQICNGFMAILLYEYVFTPAKQYLPILPVVLYNVLVVSHVWNRRYYRRGAGLFGMGPHSTLPYANFYFRVD